MANLIESEHKGPFVMNVPLFLDSFRTFENAGMYHPLTLYMFDADHDGFVYNNYYLC